jgi:hypothetical protein
VYFVDKKLSVSLCVFRAASSIDLRTILMGRNQRVADRLWQTSSSAPTRASVSSCNSGNGREFLICFRMSPFCGLAHPPDIISDPTSCVSSRPNAQALRRLRAEVISLQATSWPNVSKLWRRSRKTALGWSLRRQGRCSCSFLATRGELAAWRQLEKEAKKAEALESSQRLALTNVVVAVETRLGRLPPPL